ncbi:unnamed protein product [Brassica oleracea var. botrytis]
MKRLPLRSSLRKVAIYETVIALYHLFCTDQYISETKPLNYVAGSRMILWLKD